MRDELLHKNEELERQKESLLDQSDYLHEANERITRMHYEVQSQKDEILKKNEALLVLNNEKNNLIGIVAHDLKSPLHQIKGLLSVIKLSGTFDHDTSNCLEMIEKSADRLTQLIAKILDIEAIESRALNLHLEPFDISELVHTLVERFKIPAREKQITMHTALVTAPVVADKVYTLQILENLISNAVKFSPTCRNIYVEIEKGHDTIVSVRDEGPGFSDDDKKKLFGKYQKLSARPTGNESSSGLGLSIVKKFTEAMRGKIWCESEYGKGATFFVAFPTARNVDAFPSEESIAVNL